MPRDKNVSIFLVVIYMMKPPCTADIFTKVTYINYLQTMYGFRHSHNYFKTDCVYPFCLQSHHLKICPFQKNKAKVTPKCFHCGGPHLVTSLESKHARTSVFCPGQQLFFPSLRQHHPNQTQLNKNSLSKHMNR